MTWKNEIIVKVPFIVYSVLNYLASKFPALEFTVFVKIKTISDFLIELSEEIFLPQQEVTSSSIEIKEFPDGNWCNIHRHPNGISVFSSIDDEHASAFDMMLLFENGKIRDEIYIKLNTPLGKLPFKGKCEIVYVDVPEIDLNKIQQKTFFRDKLREEKEKEKEKEKETLRRKFNNLYYGSYIERLLQEEDNYEK